MSSVEPTPEPEIDKPEEYDTRTALSCDYLSLDGVKLKDYGDEVPFSIQPECLNPPEMMMPVLFDDICVFPGQILPVMGSYLMPADSVRRTFYNLMADKSLVYVGIIPISKEDVCPRKRGCIFKFVDYCADTQGYYSVKLVACYFFRTKDCFAMPESVKFLNFIKVIPEYEELLQPTVDIMNDHAYIGPARHFFYLNTWERLTTRMRQYLEKLKLSESDLGKLFWQSPARVSYYFVECLILSYEEKIKLFNTNCIEGRIIQGLMFANSFDGLSCLYCDAELPFKEIYLACITGVSPYYFNRAGFFNRTLSMKSDEEFEGYETIDCWFPEYGWHVRFCSSCNEHIGWDYQHVDGKSPRTFVGLGLSQLKIRRKPLNGSASDESS